MDTFDALRQFIIGFITGLFRDPDDEGLKAERVQFWDGLISDDWVREGDGVALLRTIVCTDPRAAGDQVKTLTGELERHGYRPDDLDVAGHVVSLRLSTASLGQLTECDYAAAALIDMTL